MAARIIESLNSDFLTAGVTPMEMHKMARYVTIARYIELNFEEDSRPDPRTVRSWIEAGALDYHAVKRGKQYWIDLSRPKLKSALIDRRAG